MGILKIRETFFQLKRKSKCTLVHNYYSIHTLHSNLAYLTYLIVLKINARVTCIDLNLFSTLHYLTILDLSENQLSCLSHQVFMGLTNLISLNLSHNALHFLSPEMTFSFRHLQVLDISQNPYRVSQISTEFLSNNYL